jgi:hypothetical protein
VAKLASYAEAMREIDEHREEIEHLIERGKLGDVHPPAEHIAMIAKRLPELAQKSGVPQAKAEKEPEKYLPQSEP